METFDTIVIPAPAFKNQVIGYAAGLCRNYNINPRELYDAHLEEFIQQLKAIPKLKKNAFAPHVVGLKKKS